MNIAPPAPLTADDLDRLRRMLVRHAVNLLRDGRDRNEQLDELVNEGFVAGLSAVYSGRFDPRRSAARTYAYKSAVHGVRRFLLASRAGVSTAEHNRQNANRRRGLRYPDTRRGVDLDGLHAPEAGDDDGRPSRRRVATLLALADAKDRRILTTYLEEDGNAQAVSRRLGAGHTVVGVCVGRMRKLAADVEALDAIETEVRR